MSGLRSTDWRHLVKAELHRIGLDNVSFEEDNLYGCGFITIYGRPYPKYDKIAGISPHFWLEELLASLRAIPAGAQIEDLRAVLDGLGQEAKWTIEEFEKRRQPQKTVPEI